MLAPRSKSRLVWLPSACFNKHAAHFTSSNTTINACRWKHKFVTDSSTLLDPIVKKTMAREETGAQGQRLRYYQSH